jgi:hypothetical protein
MELSVVLPVRQAVMNRAFRHGYSDRLPGGVEVLSLDVFTHLPESTSKKIRLIDERGSGRSLRRRELWC